jgi:hypothetical protein
MNRNRLKKILLHVLSILLLAGSVTAQELSGIPGAYVDIGIGIRPLGMAGAFVAVADDESAARWNPAALSSQRRSSAGFNWTKQMNLVPYNYISGTMPLKSKGLGYYAETAGDDVLRENTLAIGLGTTADRCSFIKSKNLHFGFTAKLRWASFGNNTNGGIGQVKGSAIGFGLDFGAFYQVQKIPGLTTGIMLRDALNKISWDSNISGKYSEGVPTTLAVGFAYRPGRRTLVALDIKPALYSDVYTRFAIGTEYKLLNVILIRGGIAQDIGAADVNRDVTVGMGIDIDLKKGLLFEAGIAYLFDELVNTPRVGATFRW